MVTVASFQVHTMVPAFLPLVDACTIGNDFFWSSACGRSVIVPEFQGHPGNDSLVAVISFSETRRNHRRPNYIHEGGGNHFKVLRGQNLCLT